ncbi:ninja-family protein AFP3-like [Cornus florida]|uniref:ninja-family protein AFP3-like n=1 Tax=Cornus florida TaxID=4283 RepID=UPI002897C66F|nr:ninja-family protein AFP3-like [Cornus florida]
MAEAEGKRETNRVSLQVNSFPRDLIQKIIARNHFPVKLEKPSREEVEEEDVELSLGLSLNGRFGVDPNRETKLVRSSSIPEFMMAENNYTAWVAAPVAVYAPLVRTCSLPPAGTEMETECRKRKELQSLRRMEAKRKRIEKLKNVRMVRDELNLEENIGPQNCGNGNGEFSVPSGMGSWASGATGGDVSVPGTESKPENGNCLEGSIGSGSQRSGSSGISDFESQPIKGMNKYGEARSPASVHSLPEQNSVLTPETTEKPVEVFGTAVGNPSMIAKATEKEANEMVRGVSANMPCVSTRGLGPNGKRIDGFLYQYQKGEEVRIVCVCHGSTLSPAEFVKHAGGGDVDHPLRHIVVNPTNLV